MITSLYERFLYQCQHPYPNRIKIPNSQARTSPDKIRKGLTMLAKVLLQAGVFSNYRQTFWQNLRVEENEN